MSDNPAKYIDYEITAATITFIDDQGGRYEVPKNSTEAHQLIETVALNRDLTGLNGEEAKATAEAKLVGSKAAENGKEDSPEPEKVETAAEPTPPSDPAQVVLSKTAEQKESEDAPANSPVPPAEPIQDPKA